MDRMLEFIGKRNIDLFVSRLETEADTGLRSSVRRLLLEEEDRFGQLSERLEIAAQHLRRGAERIREQRSLVSRLERDGRDAELARQTLGHLEDIQQLFACFQQSLLDMMNHRSP